MSSSFSDKELTEFVHHRYLKAKATLLVKKAALLVGHQPDSSMWVFNANTHVSGDGVLLPENETQYVWLDPGISDDRTKVRMGDLAPTIKTPLVNDPKEIIQQMILHLKVCMKHNFHSALVLLGATVMAFHYDSITTQCGGCPIPVAVGPSETGKTTAILTALSLFGCHESAYYVKGTNAFFLERSASSTLPYGIDDPQSSNRLDLPELIVDLYDAAKSANAVKGSKKPKSTPVVATNWKLQDDER